MKENLKQEKAITLIALVITVIVLLILAGVSIAMLTGDNGIITQATKSKEQTEQASDEEKIQLAVLGAKIDDNGYSESLDYKRLREELEKQFGNQKLDVIEKGYGSFLVTINDREYYVNNDKEIINSDNMIAINNLEELIDFREKVNKGNTYEGKYVYLTDNITMSDSWTPIGKYVSSDSTENIPFKGIFDGNNYTIDEIKIDSTNSGIGLFAYTDNATIKNLKIGEKSSITGNAYVGGIVGVAINQTTINNCENHAIIQGEEQIGGISGTIENGIISDCSNKATINVSTYLAGGISGAAINMNISRCYNISTIKGQLNIGGIIGSSDGSVVSSCYNTGSIQANNNAGGILGQMYNSGTVKNCYNVGNIQTSQSTNKKVGAMVGVFNDTKTINTYYLKNTINNGNDINKNCTEFTSEDVGSLYQKLGNDFENDDENINKGYPILNWQSKSKI